MSRLTALTLGLLVGLAPVAGDAQIRLDRPVGSNNPQAAPQQAPTAASNTVEAVTPDMLAGVLSRFGFTKFQALQSQRNDVKILSAEVNNFKVLVYMAGCEAQGCSNFQYAAYFGKQKVGNDFINGFNRDKRWTKLYIDGDGDLTLTMDVPLFGGVSPAFLGGTGVIFASSLKELISYKA